MLKHHRGLTPERWYRFSLMEQLADVGTDITRAIYWRKKSNLESSRQAFERAMELLDLTISDSKHKNSTLKELVLAREALIDYFILDNEYKSTDEAWQNYFNDFNYAAAIQQGKRTEAM